MSYRAYLIAALIVSALIGTATVGTAAVIPNTIPTPTPTPTPRFGVKNLVVKWAPPTYLRTTDSLDECRTYAGGGFAGIACAAAMANRWYILIWDWSGVNVDGFNVYELGKFIESETSGTQKRVAMLDPAKVGTNGCFTVTGVLNGVESMPTTPLCMNPAFASTPKHLGRQVTVVTLYPQGYRSQKIQNIHSTGISGGDQLTQQSENDLYVGYRRSTYVSTLGDAGWNTIWRTAMRFDVSGLQGHHVDYATLHLAVQTTTLGTVDNPSPNPVVSCAQHYGTANAQWWLNAEWIEGNFYGALSRSGPKVDIDLTNEVNGWLSGSANNGIVIRNDNEDLRAFTNDRCETSYITSGLEVGYE